MLKATVPTILIDEAQFCVCLYDIERDVLASQSCTPSLLIIFCLFRLFFRQLPDEFRRKYSAKIKSRLQSSTLKDLTSLNEQATQLVKIVNGDSPVVPAKGRKCE